MVKETRQGSDTGIPIFDELEESYFYLATKAVSAAIGVTWLDVSSVSKRIYGSYYKASRALLTDSLLMYKSILEYSTSPSGMRCLEAALSKLEENENICRSVFKSFCLPLGNPLVRAADSLRRGIPIKFYANTILEEVVVYGRRSSENLLPSRGFPSVSSSLWL